MPSTAAIATNVAVFCVTGIFSWLTRPATEPVPVCPACGECPVLAAAPPVVDDNRASWERAAYVATLVLVSVGPLRLLAVANYLAARCGQRSTEDHDGVREADEMGPGALQRVRPRRPLALASTPHIGGGGIVGWD